MSIFGTIMSKIFHHGQAAAPATPIPSASTATAAPAATDAGSTDAGSQTASVDPEPPMPAVDVEEMLNSIAAQYSHPVNWRYSIVDLLAILGIDNSLAQRKALAAELGYTGDTSDSATMNTWLHKEVMRKLAENGGMVPPDLLA